MGRPSKKDKLNRDGLELCYRRGFTDKEVALALQITEQTLNNWKKSDPAFFESLKDWKNQADSEVERALYQRACGYSFPAEKVVDISTGAETIVTKHMPPDATSMIFWLKNRQPAKWRDRIEQYHTGKLEIEKIEWQSVGVEQNDS